MLENCIVDASIFEFFQDCDRETMVMGFGLWWLFCGLFLVSVIVVLFEVF